MSRVDGSRGVEREVARFDGGSRAVVGVAARAVHM